MEVIKVSIDRMTILGDSIDDRLIDGLGHHPFVKSQKIAQYPYRYQWHMVDGSILQLADKAAGIPALRYEFNPNNWESNSQPDHYVMRIFKMFQSVRISRIDIAMDVKGIDFAQVKITDRKSRTEINYKGRDKSIETYYFGTRKSPIFIRIYNKAREQGLKHYKDTDWWRIEAQINGETAGLWDHIDPFEDLYITTNADVPKDYDIRTKAMLHYLRTFPDAINELSVNVRPKYKELLLATSDHSEMSLSEMYANKKENLIEEVQMWMNLVTDKSDTFSNNYNLDDVDISMAGVDKARKELEEKMLA